MRPSEDADDTKRHDPRPEPICLFFLQKPAPDPQDVPPRKTYIEASLLPKTKHSQTPRRFRKSPQSTRRTLLEEQLGGTDTSREYEERKKPRPGRRKGVFGGKKEDDWLKRRKDSRGRRKFGGEETTPHLKSLLLSSVQNEERRIQDDLPSLEEVLETVEDAWPPNRTLCSDRNEEGKKMPQGKDRRSRTVEREKQDSIKHLHFVQPLINRRFSMPEEVMRKYSVIKERTSEESEDTKTMPEITSTSSKEPEEPKKKTEQKQAAKRTGRKQGTTHTQEAKSKKNLLRAAVFSKKIDEDTMTVTRSVMTSTKGPDMSYLGVGGRSFVVLSDSMSPLSTSTEPCRATVREAEDNILNMIRHSSESETESDASERGGLRGLRESRTIKRAPLRRGSVIETSQPPPQRVTQNQYYNQGRGIICVKAVDIASQTTECVCRNDRPPRSSSSESVKGDSEDSGTSDSISSELLKEEAFSDDLSSQSSDILCTCRELTSSKETSSDLFHSGKSTLSQTVSEKSLSTQDSTVSINSVSTRGSTISADSNSTSPEVDPKTSAKETTSPENTPRTPHSRGPRGYSHPRQDRKPDGPSRRYDRPDQTHDKSCPQYRGHKGNHDSEAKEEVEHKSTERRKKQRTTRETEELQESMYPSISEQEKKSQEPLSNRTPRFLAEDLYNIPDKNLPPDPETCKFHSSTPVCADVLNCSTPITNDHKVPNTLTSPNSYSPDDRDMSQTQANVEKDDMSLKVPERVSERHVDEGQQEKRTGKEGVTGGDEKEVKPVDYHWAKLTDEEVYMMQQQRHRKFIENQRRFSVPLPHTPDTGTLAACTANGINYGEFPDVARDMMVPRYSALPRTMSMLVNTSADTSYQNSDSDNQSLADSLEEHPTTKLHRLYFDTKQETKPVRGDVALPEPRLKHRQPRGRAFFVSITDKASEDAVLTNIAKIPEPPEKIKNQIYERHLKICKKSEKEYSHIETQTDKKKKAKLPKVKNTTKSTKEKQMKVNVPKKKKTSSKKEENEQERQKTARLEKPKIVQPEQKTENFTVSGQVEDEKQPELVKERQDEIKSTQTMQEHESTKDSSPGKRKSRESKTKFHSKIPIPVSEAGRSTSSSPDREPRPPTYPGKNYKKILKKPFHGSKGKQEVKEATLIEENTEVNEAEKINTITESQPDIKEPSKTRRELKTQKRVIENDSPPVTESEAIAQSDKSSLKPQAVIHPSQTPATETVQRRQSLVTSLENTATILKLQQVQMPAKQWNKSTGPMKRSPNMRFQQRFEVIPEERSSSLTSSAEERWSTEKNRRRSLPVKLTEMSRTQMGAGRGADAIESREVRRYSMGSITNVIIAQLMGRPLQAIPCIQRGPNNENQQIIVLSPKDAIHGSTTSSKGRDALLAMNRADFNRLSQGWMNFYLLNPTSEGSENSNAEDEGMNQDVGRGKTQKYTLTNLSIREAEESEDKGKHYIIENVAQQQNADDKHKFVLKNINKGNEGLARVIEEGTSDENKNGNSEQKPKEEETNKIVCRIPSMEKMQSSTSGSSGSNMEEERGGSAAGKGLPGGSKQGEVPSLTKEESSSKCPPGSGHCNTPREEIEDEQEMSQQIEKRAVTLSQSCPPNTNQDINGSGRREVSTTLPPLTPKQEAKSYDVQTVEKSNNEVKCCNGQEQLKKILHLPEIQKERKSRTPGSTRGITGNDEKHSGSHQKGRTLVEKKLKTKPRKEMKNLDEHVRLHSSSTILQTTKTIRITPRSVSNRSKRHSLPELKRTPPKSNASLKPKSSVDLLPNVSGKRSDYEDSDSTVYFQPPSPRVPPLLLEGSGDYLTEGTVSSSDSETESRAMVPTLPIRYLPLRRRGISNRARFKRESPHTSKPGSGGWTVTVAGTVELSRVAPDVQMRLSFPVNGGPPIASQSDSGFAEDANSSQNIEEKLGSQNVTLPPANVKQKWTVTVQNPNQGVQENVKQKLSKKSYSILPDLGHPSRSMKRGPKLHIEKQKTIIQDKLIELWPKVQEILEKELQSYRMRSARKSAEQNDLDLTVSGSAVALEQKPRVLTMSERDVTRNSSSRSQMSSILRQVDIDLMPAEPESKPSS